MLKQTRKQSYMNTNPHITTNMTTQIQIHVQLHKPLLLIVPTIKTKICEYLPEKVFTDQQENTSTLDFSM